MARGSGGQGGGICPSTFWQREEKEVYYGIIQTCILSPNSSKVCSKLRKTRSQKPKFSNISGGKPPSDTPLLVFTSRKNFAPPLFKSFRGPCSVSYTVSVLFQIDEPLYIQIISCHNLHSSCEILERHNNFHMVWAWTSNVNLLSTLCL